MGSVEAEPRGREEPDDDRPSTAIDRIRARWFPPSRYHLARFAILRLFGIIYAFAFLGLVNQAIPLVGEHGLTPARDYLASLDAVGRGFSDLPTIFWLDASDTALRVCASLGFALSLLVVAGFANAPIMLALWILYGSFVRIGQLWYAYGWELQMIETGFLAIFLAPPLDPRPFPSRPPSFVVIVLFRWLAFRVFLGAGLIKLRGDACWADLTCLDFHFETQPVPNPLSPYFHAAPHWVHALGVLFNHACELVLPFFVFGPRRARRASGAILVTFQAILIASGNLSFLNWLTIVPVLACFDDEGLLALVPARLRARFEARSFDAEPTRPVRIASVVLALLVAVLSIDPVLNLLSDRQAMNRQFTNLELVNTYGAFGSVGDVRHELIIEGTRDPLGPGARWRAYEFPCKPGDPMRRPCVLGPYHHRLDWQIWFAAMGPPANAPWTLHLVAKLLDGDRATLSLFANDPFRGARPRYIRIRRFVYRFAPLGSRAYWTRDYEDEFLPPLSRDDPRLVSLLEELGYHD